MNKQGTNFVGTTHSFLLLLDHTSIIHTFYNSSPLLPLPSLTPPAFALCALAKNRWKCAIVHKPHLLARPLLFPPDPHSHLNPSPLLVGGGKGSREAKQKGVVEGLVVAEKACCCCWWWWLWCWWRVHRHYYSYSVF